MPNVEVERVSVENFQSIAYETLAQKMSESLIFFDRENVCTCFENELGQRAKTGSDFNDVIFRRKLSALDNPASKVAVVLSGGNLEPALRERLEADLAAEQPA